MIVDAEHASYPARVGYGTCALIIPLDRAGDRHPPVFHFDLHPVTGTARFQYSAFNTFV